MKTANVRELTVDALLAIEKNQAYSNLLLNQLIQKGNLPPKDVSLFTELVYGTLQRKMTLDYYLEPFTAKAKKMELWVKILLRISLYQMEYLDRIPERAIFFEAVEISKRKGHKGIAGFVNGVLRSIQREGIPSLDEIKDPAERLAIETSHPVWLVKKWAEQYGIDDTRKICEIHLKPPAASARVNRMHMTVQEAVESLNEESIEAAEGVLSEDAVILQKGSVSKSSLFKTGKLSIQDESSMLTARAVNPERNEVVLDACAAPGGKSMHMAELMEGTGEVVSLDLHKHKVKLIEEQAGRIGLANISAQVMDARKAPELLDGREFDRILVDAPCSGFGVIRRKPDIKYAKNAEDVNKLSAIQRELLDSVSRLLKKGGTLVYSTCTIDKEENEEVVADFLESHPEFEEDHSLKQFLPEKVHPYISGGKLQILPHYFETDGFFITRLKKKV
ncbi:16S rRNA (cytosine(967)-C(5))-methyltransferase RsmB [Bacillus sp. FJAT-42376]|uniref:16S rRNA (cytosine(967)-C(5))-methyltransferase RsmB n=1 Tax=Bacillus sp. FJAT-42376 TaxID=2014076 RepID=UPI000F4FBBD6|nr:16S rRNA (cytosine(967)-C(5))-methyltransferase RsmB [Bacillus sp. FJAT-42376]AZB42889.1 16S rRNA (cytosine(967)-C(5))-methyltransferase RsmB [Bacillus sp. FJAT-42376]